MMDSRVLFTKVLFRLYLDTTILIVLFLTMLTDWCGIVNRSSCSNCMPTVQEIHTAAVLVELVC